MRILSLANNALFLQNARERMRFAPVVSYIVVAVILIVLTFMACYIRPGYHSETQYNPRWAAEMFWFLIVAQGILLLALGTNAASATAARERSGGTLDFHRSSPTSRFNQILGLALGAPVLEWCILLMTLPLAIYVGLAGGIPFMKILNFYASFILCAFFFHVVGILLGFFPNRKKIVTSQRTSGLALFFVAYILFGIASAAQSSDLYHLTCYPAYVDMFQEIWKSDHRHMKEVNPLLFTFYTIRMPSLLLQAIVEIPLLLLIWQGITRRISFPDRPLFSKNQSLTLMLFILFLYIGSTISIFMEGSVKPYEVGSLVILMLGLIIFLGICGAVSATPTQLLYLKGLQRIKKLGKKEIKTNTDYSTNTFWLIAFSLIATTAYSVVGYWLGEISWFDKLATLVITLSYVVTFASALEFFNLSRHYNKRSLFWVGIVILWFFIPMLGLVTAPLGGNSSTYLQYFLAASPIMGMGPLYEIILPIAGKTPLVDNIIISLAINLILAGITILLARRERERLKAEVLGPPQKAVQPAKAS